MKELRRLITILALVIGASTVQARDWFVREGSNGDGTRDKPFRDPSVAMEEAEPGDAIHVAQGVYHGKLNSGNWVVSTPNLTLLGGYNEDFTRRNPWQFPSQLRFTKEFPGRNSGTLLEGIGSHENFVLDGFVLDQKDRNRYGTEPYASLSESARSSDPIIRLSAAGIQVRNCLILNGDKGGVDLGGDGCRIENNLILNVSGGPLVSFRSHEGEKSVIKGNTFLFSWSNRGVGGGGSPVGRGVSFWSSDHDYEIEANIFLGCDGWAVDAGSAKHLALKDNVFWLNGSSNVKVHASEQTVHVDKSNMADLEDAGLKVCQGDLAVNPELTGFDPKWMEKFLDRVVEAYPEAKLGELNEFRHSLGLPAVSDKKASSPSSYAMAYDWAQALKIVPARLQQGAHPRPLEVKPFAPSATMVYHYEPATWQKLAESPRLLDGKRVEIPGALGREHSTFNFSGISEDQYLGHELQDVQERLGQKPLAYIRKGSKAARSLKEIEQWDGNGKPETKYLIRGLVKYEAGAKTSRKGTILIDSITPMVETAPVVTKPRPAGRDWFVRAGSPGDGSKNQPFKDPWQAIEAAKTGDAIHVAEGEYFGKFKSGKWKITTAYLSLLGGYDREFKTRDPWTHPTRLGFAPGGEKRGSTPYLEVEEDHAGFILDGFILDGRDVNRLDQDGNLADTHPGGELIFITCSPDCVIRNCTLLNSCSSAIRGCADNFLIENNLILNCNYTALDVSANWPYPCRIRNNTILFTWHVFRDREVSAGGTAIPTRQGTRYEMESNIFGYADGQALVVHDRPRVQLLNNVFTHNHFANLTDLNQVVVRDNNMDLLSELGFAAATGNRVLDPQMSFDQKWWTDYSREDGPGFYARPYGWKEALKLFPQNPACSAGARPLPLEVRFSP
jgi:hypothetical protein